MKPFYKVSAYIFGGIAIVALSRLMYLTYHQYQVDKSLVNDEFMA
ncbi:hypothetical protein [Staphylococcus lutrae]|nr:hypothetical protein [Staphylococcus lutrae]